MQANQRPEKEWKTFERHVAIWDNRVVKRELREDELLSPGGNAVIRPIWARERLRNEYATLKFIAAKTTIPVPECRIYEENSILHLETHRFLNGVLLKDVEESFRPAASEAVRKQMAFTILPQLRSLRRNFIGSVDSELPVFPPQRVYNRDRRNWNKVTSEGNSFVLCHNDLGPQNIFVEPKTFRIIGIIDWEFAGYFPEYFELTLWSVFDWHEEQELYASTVARELELFGLTEEDLKDCLVQDRALPST